jgi:predicted GH43/DUF377 family glycosyl hydrolase
MSGALAIVLVEIGALAVSALFLYGLWKIVRAPKARGFLRRAKDLARAKRYPRALARAAANPLLPPTPHPWEAAAVLNPAAIEHDGRIHLFYRAIGQDGVSRIGYASSPDGIAFDERLPYPVYAHLNLPSRSIHLRQYAPTLYGSGGSWGGAEDPRAALIDGRVYLTYNAFEGWDSLRIAFTSIAEEDLARRRWNFTQPVYLTAPGTRNKNWALFPEKIGGKFAILHNLHDDDASRVRIEYVDDLDSFDHAETRIEGPDPNALPDRPQEWHTRMRSIGPPPIKTEEGWLVLYHAHDGDKHRYKLGAMLLDLDDPSKVIARASAPVLEPEAHYQDSGAKPGIVYATGAIVRDGMLVVYYGAADNFVCMAAAPLEPFVKSIKDGTNAVPLAPVLKEQYFVPKKKSPAATFS